MKKVIGFLMILTGIIPIVFGVFTAGINVFVMTDRNILMETASDLSLGELPSHQELIYNLAVNSFLVILGMALVLFGRRMMKKKVSKSSLRCG